MMLTAIADVLIAGAGPTGLSLAAASAVRGIRATVVDRRAAGDHTSPAAVVPARTLEMLETIGVADLLVGPGIHAPRFTIRDRDRILLPRRQSTRTSATCKHCQTPAIPSVRGPS